MSWIVLIVILIFTCIILYRYLFGQKFVSEPNLKGKFVNKSIFFKGHKRKYSYFFPDMISKKASILFVLHGAKDTGLTFRKRLAYEFDKIAESENLIVVYPTGYKKTWNDCRKKAKYPAKRKKIEDYSFLQEIKNQIIIEKSCDIKKTFLFGYSNGGQLVNKICFEHPETITGSGIIAANLPTDENIDCKLKNISVPIFFISGTADKVNPYYGGNVRVLGIKNLGHVLSAKKTIEYWLKISNCQNYESKNQGDIKIDKWKMKDKDYLIQYTILNGGHTIPHFSINFPKILGKTNNEINASKEIWNFFKDL